MPLAVINAMFTLLKSLGLTIECWYTNIAIKIHTPNQYNQLKLPNQPAQITHIVQKKCNNSDTFKAFFLPNAAGIE